MGMEVSWIPSYDIDLHDCIVKSDTWNINDYKGASLLWGKDHQTTACHSLPSPSSSVFSTASTTGSGLKIWGTYHCHLNQHFESDGTDNLKQGTLWRSTHDDCWCATQGMRNKSKESTNILTIIRTSGCWYNTTMSGAFTPAPKSCLYIGKC
jgi:hypothetical protein